MSGSANYLHDEIVNEKDFRVTYKYKKVSYVRSLHRYSKLNIDNEICQYEDATHIINQIDFGFDAFLVFEKTIKDETKRKDIGGKSTQCFGCS